MVGNTSGLHDFLPYTKKGISIVAAEHCSMDIVLETAGIGPGGKKHE